MTTKITMQDLIDTLRKASANPEGHAKAQRGYFSPLQEDSVLVNYNTACCVAGDLMMKAHLNEQSSQEEIDRIIDADLSDPDDWVTDVLGLSKVESTLAFDPNTHYEVHALLADLLEAGLRLPDVDYVSIDHDSTYTVFSLSYLGYDLSRFMGLGDEDSYEDPEDDRVVMNLEELKDWMREIAQ
jgi:hypothetical protein